MNLNKRIFLYFFSIFVLLLAIVTFFQYQREKEFRTEQLDQQLATYNFILAKYIDDKNHAMDLLDDLVFVFPDSTLRVTIIDSTGMVLYDSYKNNTAKFENHINRPEIQDAIRTKDKGKAIRLSHSTGMNYYYLAQRFPDMFVRTALPYNVGLVSMLHANMFFLYFMTFVLLIGMFALYLLAKKFSQSIERLRIFAKKAEEDDFQEQDICFPDDEVGEISRNIVQLYKRTLQTKDEVNTEREKLVMHLQISQEGLGIFSSQKKEILANSHFIQYISILSDKNLVNLDDVFLLPELAEINEFIDKSIPDDQLNRKRITVEKGGRVFTIQIIVFQDGTFEISINDISKQEHESDVKRHLTQNISHELKTPVSSILGYMESIIHNPDLDRERQMFFVQRSFQQAERLSSLLQDISTLNKIDEANSMYEKEYCDVSEIIADVLYDVHLRIEEKQSVVKQVTIVKLVEPGLKMQGNTSLLYSIFRNLLDNSLAHGGDHLTIEINCYREDEYYFYFSFSDNGVGLTELHLSCLFERFYRVDKGRSRKLGGTGLGLAIVKNAVMFHGGNITVKNNPNGGLNFIFTLSKY